MRVIAVFLLLTTFGVQAEWELFSQGTDGTKHYLDFSTIKKTANGYRVWDLVEYPKPRNGIWSMRGLDEFDCAEERYRSLQVDNFSGPMGRGERISGLTIPDQWTYIPPGSVAAGKLSYICSQAKKR
jgi:hypothetical protein